jgi:hypothetical protein
LDAHQPSRLFAVFSPSFRRLSPFKTLCDLINSTLVSECLPAIHALNKDKYLFTPPLLDFCF